MTMKINADLDEDDPIGVCHNVLVDISGVEVEQSTKGIGSLQGRQGMKVPDLIL